MDLTLRSQAAAALLDAYDTKLAIPPLVQTYPGMTTEDSYAVQQLQIERRLSEGRTIKGHKVGLTSAAMQRQLGVCLLYTSPSPRD